MLTGMTRVLPSPFGTAAASSAVPSSPEPAVSDMAWDRFVAAQPAGDRVQASAWARAKRAGGFLTEAVACRGPDGGIAGGALLVMKRIGRLGAVGYVARGPLLAPGGGVEAGRVLAEIERAARRHRVRYLIVQPPRCDDGATAAAMTAALAARGYLPGAVDVAPSATMLIDLAPGADGLLARMGSSMRRNVRVSQRTGLVLREAGRDDIPTFQALHAGTARRQGFTPLPVPYMLEQWDALAPENRMRLFLAEHEGRPLAGIWITMFGDTVTFRLLGWNGEENARRPNVACHWHALSWAVANGYRRCDLGGMDREVAELLVAGEEPPDWFHDTAGSFKLRLGGMPVLLPGAYQKVLNPVARLALRPFLANPRVRQQELARAARLRGGRQGCMERA